MTAPPAATVHCIGVDFTSRPSARKPVCVAEGECRGAVLHLHALHRHAGFAGFAAALGSPGALERLRAAPSGIRPWGDAGGALARLRAAPSGTLPSGGPAGALERLRAAPSGIRPWGGPAGSWIGAFDFPFGLPRELVETLRWPTSWLSLMQHYRALERSQIRLQFKAFCDARPAGAKFAHRACDRPAGSSPSMKWVNPPVAWMLHAGVPLLIDAGVHLPGLHDGDRDRVALEGYPGLLARELIGARSYKADDAARQDAARRCARKDIVAALEHGRTRLGLRLTLSPALRERLIEDACGDNLDAVLCLMQAGWASSRPGWGLPPHIDPLEGWIVTA